MINYNPKSWVKLIFAIHKSDTLRILWKELIYIGLFTLLVAYVELRYFPNSKLLGGLISVYSLIGFVISLLLVFRTNTAYDRWWEGRKKWGCMVNDTRNLAVKVNMLDLNDQSRDYFRRMIANFVFAMKEHLRSGVNMEELDLTDDERRHIERQGHIPMEIVNGMYQEVQLQKQKGLISDADFFVIDRNLNAFLDNLGACERIRNTPIPFSYSLFIKKFIFIYVVTMPLAFVTNFGYWSALIATFMFYVLVSMEVLAEEIEDPFGTDANDLPTDELCVKIRGNVNQVLEKKA